MVRTSVVIIGAGQAGLAVSHLLGNAGVDHVLLERGHTAQSWRSRRWDSLRLLTPNWMTRLPGWCYQGADRAGFMPAGEVASFLSGYASSFGAPIVHGAAVLSVRRLHTRLHRPAYLVETGAGTWTAPAVVIATGYSNEPVVPAAAAELPHWVTQLTPDRYLGPAGLPAGGVLVVGASATGVQLADELRAAGRDVVLAAGRHTRVPRQYRGMDIMWWLDSIGALDRPVAPGGQAGRSEPSMQLVGSSDARLVDLPSLAARGVRLAGRFRTVTSGLVQFDDDLATTTAIADRRLDRLLGRIDAFASRTRLDHEVGPATRPAPFLPGTSSEAVRKPLPFGTFRSVIWATGYRPRYLWLQVPVLDDNGRLIQSAGRTPAPGLMVVGLQRQTRRNSAFIDGVGHDAGLVVDHILSEVLRRRPVLRMDIAVCGGTS